MFSTRVERLSFWPKWQVMLLLDQRDWAKLLIVALPGTIACGSTSTPTSAEQNTWMNSIQNTDTSILLSDSFNLSIYTDISFKSFGVIDTLCGSSSHPFDNFLLFFATRYFLYRMGKNKNAYGNFGENVTKIYNLEFLGVNGTHI